MVNAMGRFMDRAAHETRPLVFNRNFIDSATGSCFIECGRTRVICTAMAEAGVPSWMKGQKRGWGR